jgi:DNA-binding transcriptional regulator YiaG
MARPKKERDETRPHRIIFRLTGAEMKQLRQQAEAAGVSPHEYARMLATGAAGAQARVTGRAEPPGAFELRQQLIRVGNNMNQIARRLNARDEYQPDELRTASRDLDQIFRRMLDGVTFH